MTFFEGFTRDQRGGGGRHRTPRVRRRIGAADGAAARASADSPWYDVAPRLVRAGYSVICPDMHGYGRSSKPPTTADHAPYSKRAMARDVVALMTTLGHEQFSVAGHDRGSCIAQRLALDHPSAVTAVALLDCVPIGEALAGADARFATAWWHWFVFAQPEKPARAILRDPQAWYGGRPDRMGIDNHADFLSAINDPATVRAMLEDYRAGLGVDRRADDDDRAADRVITCPTMLLWSTRDDLEDLYGDVLAVWRPWTTSLTGGPVDSGHPHGRGSAGRARGQIGHILERPGLRGRPCFRRRPGAGSNDNDNGYGRPCRPCRSCRSCRPCRSCRSCRSCRRTRWVPATRTANPWFARLRAGRSQVPGDRSARIPAFTAGGIAAQDTHGGKRGGNLLVEQSD